MIAVLGGTGFIGGRLVERLRGQGREVVVISHRARGRPPEAGTRWADLLEPDSLRVALSGATTVVQSTCFPGYPLEKRRRGLTFENFDAVGTRNAVVAARMAGAQRYLFVSGVGAGPDPTKPYFRAIHLGEEAVKGSGMSWAILRPALVFGPADRGLNRIIAAARRTPLLPVVGLQAMHQPIFIDDLVRALATLAEPGAVQGTFEMGGPERFTMGRMLDRAFALAGVRCRCVELPGTLARLGAAVLERLPFELVSRSAVAFISESFTADNAPLLRALGPLPLTRLEDGLRPYLAAGALPAHRRAKTAT